MKKIIFLMLVAAYMPNKVNAWGMIGHRVVGQVADFYLQPKAKSAIKSILGTESIAMASNWPDFIKSDSTFKYLDSWHYVNLAANMDKKAVFNFLETETNFNVYNKTLAQIEVLKNKKSTLAQKKFALRLLIHFVGDLHQPMHTARKEDLGGNKIYVTWFGERYNLHRMWDEGLISYQQLSYTEYANVINYPTAKQLSAWKKYTLKDDIYDSYQACNLIYEKTKMDDKLSYKYNFEFVEMLNNQLLKGGVRLANILNDIYS